jgi:lysozyme
MNKEEMAVELIMQCEGFESKAYFDKFGAIWTIGFGTTRDPEGTVVKKGDICTFEQAQRYLVQFLKKTVYGPVKRLCGDMPVPDAVYAALCSLIYNVGITAASKSIKNAVEDQDWKLLAEIFRKYDKIHADDEYQICPALQKRREKEVNYFLSNLH